LLSSNSTSAGGSPKPNDPIEPPAMWSAPESRVLRRNTLKFVF